MTIIASSGRLLERLARDLPQSVKNTIFDALSAESKSPREKQKNYALALCRTGASVLGDSNRISMVVRTDTSLCYELEIIRKQTPASWVTCKITSKLTNKVVFECFGDGSSEGDRMSVTVKTEEQDMFSIRLVIAKIAEMIA